ncbi:MAG: TetR/AcrR family transcriptional regulator [Brevundimonas sp.]
MSNLDALHAAVADPPEPRPRPRPRRDSPNCQRQRNKARTRERILAAATDMFGVDGYEKATIRALADRIGMSTGAIFANFPDKAALYREIYGHPPMTPAQGVNCLAALAGLMTSIDADNRVSDEAQSLALTILRSIDPDWRATFRDPEEAAAELEGCPW